MNEIEYLKKLRDNLTERINELEGIVPIKDQKAKIRALFAKRYEDKSVEITSNKAKLPWSGKEAKLLRDDLAIHGYDILVKYIEIFFSDKDQNVADFTRHRSKAGYSFSVFHGMIPKLSMSKVKPAKVCKYCGRAVGHTLDCPVSIKIRADRDKEVEEINRLKDENKNISFMDMFKNNLKGA